MFFSKTCPKTQDYKGFKLGILAPYPCVVDEAFSEVNDENHPFIHLGKKYIQNPETVGWLRYWRAEDLTSLTEWLIWIAAKHRESSQDSLKTHDEVAHEMIEYISDIISSGPFFNFSDRSEAAFRLNLETKDCWKISDYYVALECLQHGINYFGLETLTNPDFLIEKKSQSRSYYDIHHTHYHATPHSLKIEYEFPEDWRNFIRVFSDKLTWYKQVIKALDLSVRFMTSGEKRAVYNHLYRVQAEKEKDSRVASESKPRLDLLVSVHTLRTKHPLDEKGKLIPTVERVSHAIQEAAPAIPVHELCPRTDLDFLEDFFNNPNDY